MKRPEECCVFPMFEKEHDVFEKCVSAHGAQAARLMADKTPGPARGSVSNPSVAGDYINQTESSLPL